MFTKAELIDAINELEAGKHSIQNCEKLAAIYTVLDHLYPEEEPKREYSLDRGYSGEMAPLFQQQTAEQKVGNYGSTDFLHAVAGRNAKDMWLLMDEVMEAVRVLNPRLYDNVMAKL